MTQDYVGSVSVVDNDELLHMGVLGMHWGQRKSHTTGVGRHIGGVATRYSRHRKAIVEIPKGGTVPKVGNVIAHPGSHTGRIKVARITKIKSTTNRYNVLGGDTKYPLTHKTKLIADRTTKLDHAFNHPVVHRTRVVTTTARLGITATRGILAMSNEETPNDYVGAYVDSNGDLSHYGVRGMKWGVRNDSAGSSLATHRATVDKKHLANNKQLSTKGARLKRGLTTDFTLSPYRSAGRLRRGKSAFKKITFNDLTGKQQSKLIKSLARDRSKLMEKKLSKVQRGKKDYLKELQNNSKLRDQQVRYHAGLFKFGKRNKAGGESRKKYAFTQTNWPRLIPVANAWGVKTGLGMQTYGVSALATRGISKHSDDIGPNDYVGAYRNNDADLEHFGVRGMRWGIRNSSGSGGGGSSSGSKPTRARAKEKTAASNAKQHAVLSARIDKLKAGEGRSLTVNGKQLSRAESIKHLEKQASKIAPKIEKGKQLKKELKALVAPIHKDEPESPTEKYHRLKQDVANGNAHKLNDEDLKFLNTRREALTKANAAFNNKESGLNKRLKKAVDTALTNQMNVALGLLAVKFIGGPLAAKIAGKNADKTKDAVEDIKDAFKPKPDGSYRFKYSSGLGMGNNSPSPFRMTATQSGPGFSSRPLQLVGSRPLLALPPGPGPVYKVTTLGD